MPADEESRSYRRDDESLERIEQKIDRLLKEVKHMAIDQATFDTDLGALVASITTLTTAVDAALAKIPAADLSAEDKAVQDASAAVAAELAKITPTPVP